MNYTTVMKKTSRYLLLIFTLLLVLACSRSEKRLIGDWDDNIKLSQKEAKLEAAGGSVQIYTEGTWWWIDVIDLNGVYEYNFNGQDSSLPDFKYETEAYKVVKSESSKLLISMERNNSGVTRTLTIGLQAGNYFDSIRITQAAE